ncbi:hypothetical protein [Ruegeria atlantica]|uniref:Uncharacterized protein n=1 Tax=Ruegeria atlantica TaxID=81569 RepID=A0A0P1FA13_9RHOB|nr:hypothetical protein [Ruegeria atlantica]CUH50317.1 hypothetical protein RUA4292_04525 [Ruegeria atlantica]
MADKSSIRTGIEFSATAIAVIGAAWAGKSYFENWMQDTIEKAVEDKVIILEQLQLADLLAYYGYPDEAIEELKLISDRITVLESDNKRKIAFYDRYLDAVALSENTLKYEPEIRLLKDVFSTVMQTDGWHDENLAYVSMFLPEARADDAFFDAQVIGRLNLAVHQYEVESDFEGLESAFDTLALAYLCRGDQESAQASIERAAEMMPFDYFLVYPLMGADVIAEDPEIEKLNAVCPQNVSRGYGALLQELYSGENPFRDLIREYSE